MFIQLLLPDPGGHPAGISVCLLLAETPGSYEIHRHVYSAGGTTSPGFPSEREAKSGTGSCCQWHDHLSSAVIVMVYLILSITSVKDLDLENITPEQRNILDGSLGQLFNSDKDSFDLEKYEWLFYVNAMDSLSDDGGYR